MRGSWKIFFNVPNVTHVSGATGRYEYIATFAATSRDMVVDVTSQIHNVKGVTRTESFLLLRDIGIYIKSDKFSKLYKAYIEMEE